jgi:hypothetical protein
MLSTAVVEVGALTDAAANKGVGPCCCINGEAASAL